MDLSGLYLFVLSLDNSYYSFVNNFLDHGGFERPDDTSYSYDFVSIIVETTNGSMDLKRNGLLLRIIGIKSEEFSAVGRGASWDTTRSFRSDAALDIPEQLM